MHLKADELVDLAEGARAESSAPHLVECGQCRAQLADLRAMMSLVAADVPVPEPSPLFWDHFSGRVQQQVAADAASRRLEPLAVLRTLLASGRLRAAAAALASLVIIIVATSRTRAPGWRTSVAEAPAAAPELFADAPIESDQSLSFVAILAADLDADAVAETGLARVGSADHAVTHMSRGELRELQRLLQEQLAP
jgi:hypothetical protein